MLTTNAHMGRLAAKSLRMALVATAIAIGCAPGPNESVGSSSIALTECIAADEIGFCDECQSDTFGEEAPREGFGFPLLVNVDGGRSELLVFAPDDNRDPYPSGADPYGGSWESGTGAGVGYLFKHDGTTWRPWRTLPSPGGGMQFWLDPASDTWDGTPTAPSSTPYAAGDFDGDGKSDVVVRLFPIGELVVYYGREAYGTAHVLPFDPELFEAELLHTYWEPSTQYGRRMLAADLNGDVYDDLIVVDPERGIFTEQEIPVPGAGAVFVHYGSASGIDWVPDRMITAAAAGVALEDCLSFGADIAADNVTAGPFDDLLISMPGCGANGAVLVLSDGLVHAQTIVPSSAEPLDGLVTGDVDGNGIADLVARQGSDLVVYFASSGSTPFADPPVALELYGAAAGTPRAVGDVDGDGAAEIFAMAPVFYMLSEAPLFLPDSRGELQVFQGVPGDVPLPINETSFLANPLGDYVSRSIGGLFGLSVLAEDIDGDGSAEVVVGAPAFPWPDDPYLQNEWLAGHIDNDDPAQAGRVHIFDLESWGELLPVAEIHQELEACDVCAQAGTRHGTACSTSGNRWCAPWYGSYFNCEYSGGCNAHSPACGTAACEDHFACGSTELYCADGIDNDADGLLDCFDTAECHPSQCVEICGNGLDDELDTLPDCQDPDCAESSWCTPTESSCSDGVDNDGDGATDCLDLTECRLAPDCIEVCTNGIDDDGDLGVDCADAECAGAAGCVEVCTNGVDDDADGLVDCNDPECDGVGACPPGSSTMPTGAASLLERHRELIEGSSPRQAGVTAGTIVDARAGYLFGWVYQPDGSPLAGVRVEILNHSELGHTVTAPDGRFDLLVNAGGPLVIRYTLSGYLESQRTLHSEWGVELGAPDVVLVPRDSVVTTLSSGATTSQVGRGSREFDTDGDRQATLYVPPGVEFTARLENGTTSALSSISFRATEYTVGDRGPERMPGDLPRQIAYTYAVELSADEADAMGAVSVELSNRAYFYLENFIGMPVGTGVPIGYYDRQSGRWVPSEDGVIVTIVSETSGRADVDIDGDGTADGASLLTEWGFTDEERAQLATLYAPGQELWRVPIEHFTPWDCNWPYEPDSSDPDGPPDDPRGDDEPDPDSPCAGGSIIECQNQTLGESFPVNGTSLTLNYRSDRVPGRRERSRVRVPVAVSSGLPPGVLRVEAFVELAGRRFAVEAEPATLAASFPADEGIHYFEVPWDGKDSTGRSILRPVSIRSQVCYVFGLRLIPLERRREAPRFGGFGGRSASIGASRSASEVRYCREISRNQFVGIWDARGSGFLGLTLSAQDEVDPHTASLGLRFQGDGRTAPLPAQGRLRHVLGGGSSPMEAGVEPRSASIHILPGMMGAAADGSLYFLNRSGSNNGIYRLSLAGELTLVHAHNLIVDGFAVDASGDVFLIERWAGEPARIIRVSPEGTVTPIGGELSTHACDYSGDDGPASDACVWGAENLGIDAAGNVYFTQGSTRIRRIDVQGTITTVVGGGTSADPFAADGVRASGCQMSSIDGPWVSPRGEVWFTFNTYIPGLDNSGRALARLSANGSIEVISKLPDGDYVLEPVDASGHGLDEIEVATHSILDVTWGADATIYLLDDVRKQVFRLPGGERRLVHLAGDGSSFFAAYSNWNDSDDPRLLRAPRTIAAMPDGRLYMATSGSVWINEPSDVFRPTLAGYELDDSRGLRFEYDAAGLVQRIVSDPFGDVVLSHHYDAEGRLDRLTDRAGNDTTIERTPNTVTITGPFGDVTRLVDENGDGYVDEISNDGVSSGYALTYGRGPQQGLLLSMVDRTGTYHRFGYDDEGRLTLDEHVGVGQQTLARTAYREERGSVPFFVTEVTRTSAAGYPTTYLLARGRDGTVDRKITYPDGTYATRFLADDRHVETRDRAGTTAVFERIPDPALGWAAPTAAEVTYTTPAGRMLTASQSVDITRNSAGVLTARTASATLNPGGSSPRTWSTTFDSVSRTVTRTSPEGRTVTVTLDSLGRPSQMSTPGLNALHYNYDGRGRLETMSAGSGPTSLMTTYLYADPSQAEPTGVQGPDGQVTSLTFDALGRLTGLAAAGASMSRAFDEGARTITVTPPGRPDHVLQFDAGLRLAEYRPPTGAGGSGAPWSWAHDGDDALVSRTLGDGRAVTLAPFDAAGRVTALQLQRGTVDITYDPNTGAADTATMPAAMAGELGQSLDWDFDGPLLTKVTYGGLVSGIVDYGYDPNTWELTSEQVGGLTVAYSYDDDGLLTSAGLSSNPLVVQRRGSGTNGLLEYVDIGVDPDGSGPERAPFSTATTFDAFGRWEVWTTTWPTGGSYGEELDYFEDSNRVRCRTDSDGAGTPSTSRYVYDAAGRLTHVYEDANCAGAGTLTAQYSYDDQGNRTAWTDGRGSFVGIYDDQDRLVRVELPDASVASVFTHDGHGQLASRIDDPNGTAEVTTYTYDERGDLLQVVPAGGPTVAYRVDALGRRVQRRVGGAVERSWLYRDGSRPIAELDSTGSVRAVFVYASRGHVPDLMIAPGGATYRIVTDHLGSVRFVVNAATGAVAQELDYDAFGRVTRDTQPGFQPFGFAGGLYDHHTELVRFGARDYDPDVGRWTAKDPILFGGGDTNLYAYVGNDPINWIDPSGLYLETAIDVISIGYDIYVLFDENILGDCDTLGTNLLALGADVAGLLLPVATGLGAGVRAGSHADEAYDALRRAGDVVDDVPGCFEAGTVVATDSGPQPIETLSAGDLVWSRNEETGELSEQRVLELLVRPDQQILAIELVESEGGEESLRTTGEHPFWVEHRGWTPARELHPGDRVFQLSGGWLRVASATWAQERDTVYNLNVETTHTYFVGELGAWVHNTCQWRDIPFRDQSGKIHIASLPDHDELRRYSRDELEFFRDELRGSVAQRIDGNARLGPQGDHGLRQAQEQQLLHDVERLLDE